MLAYLGNAIQRKTEANNAWIYWSHVRNYFYVYSYAAGLLIANALHMRVYEDPSYITVIKEKFFCVGNASSPLAMFVDM